MKTDVVVVYLVYLIRFNLIRLRILSELPPTHTLLIITMQVNAKGKPFGHYKSLMH